MESQDLTYCKITIFILQLQVGAIPVFSRSSQNHSCYLTLKSKGSFTSFVFLLFQAECYSLKEKWKGPPIQTIRYNRSYRAIAIV